MGNNLKIMGNTFSNISSITAHDATSGIHKYVDTSDTTAVAGDIKKNKTFYGADGVKIQGTLEVYAGEHHQPTPSGYTVTVSLTNPVNPSHFSSCIIREGFSDDPDDFGQQLGQINSATGSTEVMVSSSLYGIIVIVDGAAAAIDSSGISCTGGVAFSSTTETNAAFSVTGNGTATIDGIDYDW